MKQLLQNRNEKQNFELVGLAIYDSKKASRKKNIKENGIIIFNYIMKNIKN